MLLLFFLGGGVGGPSQIMIFTIFSSAGLWDDTSLLPPAPPTPCVPLQYTCPILGPRCQDWLSHHIYSCTQGIKRGSSLFQSCQIFWSYKRDSKQNLAFGISLGAGRVKKQNLTSTLTFTWQINKNEAWKSTLYLLYAFAPSLPNLLLLLC